MSQWKIKVGSRICPHSDGYGGCKHPKSRTPRLFDVYGYDVPCRNKHCPIKVKEEKKKPPVHLLDVNNPEKTMCGWWTDKDDNIQTTDSKSNISCKKCLQKMKKE